MNGRAPPGGGRANGGRRAFKRFKRWASGSNQFHRSKLLAAKTVKRAQGGCSESPRKLPFLRQAIAEQEETTSRAKPIVLVVSGHQVGRETHFVSLDREVHPDDLPIKVADSTHGEHLLQERFRSCGIDSDEPKFQVWTSERTWKLVHVHLLSLIHI